MANATKAIYVGNPSCEKNDISYIDCTRQIHIQKEPGKIVNVPIVLAKDKLHDEMNSRIEENAPHEFIPAVWTEDAQTEFTMGMKRTGSNEPMALNKYDIRPDGQYLMHWVVKDNKYIDEIDSVRWTTVNTPSYMISNYGIHRKSVNKNSNNYMTVSSDIVLNQKQWTYSAWVKCTQTTPGVLMNICNGSNASGFYMSMDSKNFHFGNGSATGNITNYTYDFTKWTHIEVDWDGTNALLFIDGKKKDTVAVNRFSRGAMGTGSYPKTWLYKWDYGDGENGLYRGWVYDCAIITGVVHTADFEPDWRWSF